jgi:hypothetical protein
VGRACEVRALTGFGLSSTRPPRASVLQLGSGDELDGADSVEHVDELLGAWPAGG